VAFSFEQKTPSCGNICNHIISIKELSKKLSMRFLEGIEYQANLAPEFGCP